MQSNNQDLTIVMSRTDSGDNGDAFLDPTSEYSSDPVMERVQYRASHYSDTSKTEFLKRVPSDGSDSDIIPEETKPTFWQKVKTAIRYVRPMLTTILIDVLIPLAVYFLLKKFTTVLVALIVSGVPPFLHVIYGFIKHRKVNVLGCIFVLSYIISAILSIISGDVRLTLLRDSSTSAIISFMFFITMIPIRTRWFCNRPLIFLISQQIMEEAPPIEWTDGNGVHHSVPRANWCWDYFPVYKKICYTLNAIWGIILMAEFIAKVVMIELTSLTVEQIVLYGYIILIVIMVTMTVATAIITHRVLKLIAAFAATWLKQNDFSKRLPK